MKKAKLSSHANYFSIEDYQGPTSSGFFKWMPDENGQMRPVTRMKEKTLDKPGMWNKGNSENDE